MRTLIYVVLAFTLTIPLVYCAWFLFYTWAASIYYLEYTPLNWFAYWVEQEKQMFLSWSVLCQFIACFGAFTYGGSK